MTTYHPPNITSQYIPMINSGQSLLGGLTESFQKLLGWPPGITLTGASITLLIQH